jgi:hypothetical protein
MLAILLTIIATAIPFTVLFGLKLFGTIAEYQENPVIDLVEELRKKHSNTNEN